jgi:hypothetical protein
VNSPREPITHGGRYEVGCILLHEVPGSGDGHQGEVLLYQIPKENYAANDGYSFHAGPPGDEYG